MVDSTEASTQIDCQRDTMKWPKTTSRVAQRMRESLSQELRVCKVLRIHCAFLLSDLLFETGVLYACKKSAIERAACLN